MEQDNHAVFVTLVEHLGRIQYAVSRRSADILVDSHFHLRTVLLVRRDGRQPQPDDRVDETGCSGAP